MTESGFDNESFVTTLCQQMEANQRMIDALEGLNQSDDSRTSGRRGYIEGLQESIEQQNRQMKDFTRDLGIEVDENERPSNWDQVLTPRD